ncbi:MAG TPA: hypothetical protein VMI06_17350 [Terriglobia bacterium]|nr:hypothetical protein [Terriglobia bacterium]
MTHSFGLKLDRAREHLQAFEQEAEAWVKTKPYAIVDEPDPNPPPQPIGNAVVIQRRFRVTRVDPVPGRLSLILGDCLFNIRSSLDHLALYLAKNHTPNMTPTQIRGSEFPIFQKPPSRPEERRKIGYVAPAVRSVIMALQPYHRGNTYHTHPLWQIHELNNIDKHRMLTVCITSPSVGGEKQVRFQVKEGGWNLQPIYIAAKETELKIDAIIMQYAGILIDPNRDTNADPLIPLEVTFGPGGPTALELIVPTVQAFCDFVRDSVIIPLAGGW